MSDVGLLDELVDALRCLPGVGPKSGQRMAYHLLERDRVGGKRLAAMLQAAMERIGHCSLCRNFTEQTTCHLCGNTRRDYSQLCVVESPADVRAIEQTADYRGRYFVLMGRLSPLDGIGPEQIGLPFLKRRLMDEHVRELILALGSTVEAEATAHYIKEQVAAPELAVTRIAYGVPMGGELEFVDGATLAHALRRRDVL